MKKLFLIFTLLICSVSYGQRCVGNCTNGQGTYYYSGGNKYVGEWQDGKKHGEGTYTFVSGEKYSGGWQYGKRHGQGKVIFPSGIIKSGFWWNSIYIETKSAWDEKERERIAKIKKAIMDGVAKKERERIARETAQEKYNKIYNACLLDKSSGADMQVSSIRSAVEETCESIAEDPSWYYEIKYFRL